MLVRYNPFLAVALTAVFALLAVWLAATGRRLRLWRQPLAWGAAAVTAVILYGVLCPYPRVRQASIRVQVEAARLKRGVNRIHDMLGLPPVAYASPVNPERYLPRSLHKTGHVALFALLSALLGLVLLRPAAATGTVAWKRGVLQLLALATGLALFGLALEGLQLFTPEREPKLRDFLFDLKGIGIGLATAILLALAGEGRRRFRDRRRRRQAAAPTPAKPTSTPLPAERRG